MPRGNVKKQMSYEWARVGREAAERANAAEARCIRMEARCNRLEVAFGTVAARIEKLELALLFISDDEDEAGGSCD